MDFLLMILGISAWIWSLIRGYEISLLCCVLNFFFPPLSQIIYSVLDERMRIPLLAMCVVFCLKIVTMFF